MKNTIAFRFWAFLQASAVKASIGLDRFAKACARRATAANLAIMTDNLSRR